MLLQFSEQLAELLGKTGAARAGAKQFQFAFVPHQQGAQHHHPAFLGEQSRWQRNGERVEDEPRKPLERKNIQPRVPGQGAVGEQLAFELKRGLFGREQDQRRAFRRCRQGGADFRQTAKRLAAAGRTEEKTRLHGFLFAQRREMRKAIYCQILARVGWWAVVFFVSFQTNRSIIPFRRGNPGWLITTIKIENLCH